MKLKTKQVQVLSYKTRQVSASKYIVLLSLLTALGVLGRVMFQWMPSVEPIVPLAVAVSFFGGKKEGAFLGVSGFFISNFFVWGFQGPWTLFQCIGAGGAGFIGGLMSKVSNKRSMFFTSLVLGTIFYEVVVNLGSFVYFPWALIATVPYLMSSLPFGVVHIVSSIGFGSMFYAFRDKLRCIWKEEVLVARVGNNTGNSNDFRNKAEPTW
ncbi:MAG: hypothetical protein J7L45_01595 [Candidatus Aenigmarchaeota archaeon]|nr:hypothetical protein [Candidatus Aenigmarchaeota archaeon]